MLLADEYLITDLKQKCEEDIISKLDSNNILQILLFVEQHSNIISQPLLEKTNSIFIDQFDKIHKLNPNLEQEITMVPGLMTVIQKFALKKIRKGRKVHFVVDDYEESDSDDYIRNYTQHFYQ
ncbi:unnamed protein product [Paramecium sonneborni]|uniref:Uncharacterized protein n=1 Tax=Paramecium sonneborni TaxID=65129 RepID=A0A8S1PF25_9CILI|nr:unnamed protein product [Paramecium sonneborni]